MKGIEEIREDLNKIRYYNAKKEWFDKMETFVGRSEAADLSTKYNAVICKAHPRVYEFYVNMYVLNNTQETIADDLDYSMPYIGKLSKMMMEYLQSNID